MELDLEVGDVILTGKFKNKRKVVKAFGKDDLGQPTINGTKALSFRIEKLMPKDKWSKKSKEALEFADKVDEMKITKRQLSRIIKGEIQRINEAQAPGHMAIRLQTEKLMYSGFDFDIIQYIRPGKYVVRGVPVDQVGEVKETIRAVFDAYVTEEITGSRPNLKDLYYGV
jgi:hypothetical protein